MLDHGAPAAVVPDSVAEGQGRESSQESLWNRDRPGQREAEARVCGAPREEDDGCKRSRRCKDGIFERSEAEDPDACLTGRKARRLQRLTIDDEATPDDEHAEAGRD